MQGTENKKEIWEPVNNYEADYLVSTKGRVKSIKFNKHRILSPWLRKGYLLVKLSNSKSIKTLSVHILVLESFKNKRPFDMEAMHLNGISTDNRLTNLQWGSRKLNVSHKFKHKNMPNKLSEKQVLRIKKLGRKGMLTQTKIAAKFGVNQSQISRIIANECWEHVK